MEAALLGRIGTKCPASGLFNADMLNWGECGVETLPLVLSLRLNADWELEECLIRISS